MRWWLMTDEYDPYEREPYETRNHPLKSTTSTIVTTSSSSVWTKTVICPPGGPMNRLFSRRAFLGLLALTPLARFVNQPQPQPPYPIAYGTISDTPPLLLMDAELDVPYAFFWRDDPMRRLAVRGRPVMVHVDAGYKATPGIDCHASIAEIDASGLNTGKIVTIYGNNAFCIEPL